MKITLNNTKNNMSNLFCCKIISSYINYYFNLTFTIILKVECGCVYIQKDTMGKGWVCVDGDISVKNEKYSSRVEKIR